MKISERITEFVYSNKYLVDYLFKNSRNDIVVVAIILTEMYFNNLTKRYIEYIAFVGLFWLFPKRINLLSVGIGQIQIRHWRQLGFINKEEILKAVIKFTNPLLNYDIIDQIISDSKVHRSDKSKVIAIYRGETRAFHFHVFNQIINTLEVKLHISTTNNN